MSCWIDSIVLFTQCVKNSRTGTTIPSFYQSWLLSNEKLTNQIHRYFLTGWRIFLIELFGIAIGIYFLAFQLFIKRKTRKNIHSQWFIHGIPPCLPALSVSLTLSHCVVVIIDDTVFYKSITVNADIAKRVENKNFIIFLFIWSQLNTSQWKVFDYLNTSSLWWARFLFNMIK